jgi:hypothetical protein
MSGIFISYRREDSAGWTGRLSEQLKGRFGADSIFMDIDTLAPGVDFTDALQKAVGSCSMLLAMIGPKWATVADKSGKPRLEDPNDWVRVEIAAALKRKIRVIPVLVGGASVPTMDLLPDELDALAHRHAHELTDKRWKFDVEQLMNVLPPPPRPPRRSYNELLSSKPVLIGGLMITMLASARFVLPSGVISPSHHDDVAKPAEVGTANVKPGPTMSVQAIAQPIPSAAPQVMHLRVGEEARFKDSRTSWAYTVLAVQVDPAWKDTASLRVTVRATNEGALTAGFGDSNFSLLVDGSPRAPTSNLHDSVDSHSAKEGTIVFAVPSDAQQLVLQLLVGDAVAEMPVDMTKTRPLMVPPLPPAQAAHLDKVKFPVALRAGQETHLKDHRATCVYKVLATQVVRARPDMLSLTVTVRVASEGPLKTDFSNNNFRLLIDDVPRTPTSHLNDSVDPHSMKEGIVEFAVPVTAKRVVLQLRMEDQVAELPLDLSPLWL